jgi:hypothetical protein
MSQNLYRNPVATSVLTGFVAPVYPQSTRPGPGSGTKFTVFSVSTNNWVDRWGQTASTTSNGAWLTPVATKLPTAKDLSVDTVEVAREKAVAHMLGWLDMCGAKVIHVSRNASQDRPHGWSSRKTWDDPGTTIIYCAERSPRITENLRSALHRLKCDVHGYDDCYCVFAMLAHF